MGFVTNLTAGLIYNVYGANSKPSGVDNDHGNVRDGGAIADSDKFSSNALGEGNPVITLVSGIHNQAALVGPAVWNYKDSRGDIVRYTTTLARYVSNDALLGGDSDGGNSASINQVAAIVTRYYKSAIRNADWIEFSGAWKAGTPAVGTQGFWNISAVADNGANMKVSGTDNAANPSNSKPGELTYFEGSGPKNDVYKPRYNW